jgi:hypothetical protein
LWGISEKKRIREEERDGRGRERAGQLVVRAEEERAKKE